MESDPSRQLLCLPKPSILWDGPRASWCARAQIVEEGPQRSGDLIDLVRKSLPAQEVKRRPGVFLTKKRFELDFRGTRFPHPVFGSNPVHCRTRLFAVKDRVYAARPAQEAGSKGIEWLKELAMSTTFCLHAVRLFDPITLSPS